MSATYKFRAKLWLYDGSGAWVFVTLPKDCGEEIKMITADNRRGFGSVRVHATIGSETWKTSVFPDSKSGSYVLPVKKEVRKSTDSDVGDMVDIAVSLIDM